VNKPFEDLALDAATGGVSHEALAAALARREAERERAVEAILSGDYEIVEFDD